LFIHCATIPAFIIGFAIMRHLIFSLLVLVLCAACGVKGALEKPSGSVPPPPPLDRLTPAPEKAPSADVNTPPESPK
jgi:predicted small lipoprotein YifL